MHHDPSSVVSLGAVSVPPAPSAFEQTVSKKNKTNPHAGSEVQTWHRTAVATGRGRALCHRAQPQEKKSQMASGRPGSCPCVQVAPCHFLPSQGFILSLAVGLSAIFLLSRIPLYNLRSSTCCWTSWRLLHGGKNLERRGKAVSLCTDWSLLQTKKTNKPGELVAVLFLSQPSPKPGCANERTFPRSRFPRGSLESWKQHQELHGR